MFQNNSKYHAKKTTIDGIVFDSKKEALHFCVLRALERKGNVSNLQRQVKFVLIPSEKGIDGKKQREISYYADFVYYDSDGIRHVQDVKGVKTPVYRLKKRLMWHVHHINVEEI